MVRPTAPAIPLKMYRHFAAVTLALTSAMALFADGERRAAIYEHVAEQKRENALRRESHARFGAPRLLASPPVIGKFADEPASDTEFGSPMDRPHGGVGNRGSAIDPADAAGQLGYSQDYLDSLSTEERDLLLKGLEENGLLSEGTRNRQAAAMEAASARRSGSPTSFE